MPGAAASRGLSGKKSIADEWLRFHHNRPLNAPYSYEAGSNSADSLTRNRPCFSIPYSRPCIRFPDYLVHFDQSVLLLSTKGFLVLESAKLPQVLGGISTFMQPGDHSTCHEFLSLSGLHSRGPLRLSRYHTFGYQSRMRGRIGFPERVPCRLVDDRPSVAT